MNKFEKFKKSISTAFQLDDTEHLKKMSEELLRESNELKIEVGELSKPKIIEHRRLAQRKRRKF